jgi:plastocyanin
MPAVPRRSPLPRRALAALALAGLTAGLGSLAAPPQIRAAEHAIQIADSAFSPATLTISVGDSVTWTNADDRPHTVTSNDGAFDSGNLDEGRAFSFTFTEPGTYTYVCNYHPKMQATIVVTEGSAPASTASGGSRGSNDAASGGGQPAAAPASHAPSAHEGSQPDTALEAPISQAWLAPVLIGLGLVSLAFGVIPPAAVREAAEPRERA